MIEISVDGRPAPKGSRIAGITKTGNTYTRPGSRYEKPWVEAVKAATQLAIRHHRPTEKPYVVTLDFRLKRPQTNRAKMPWWPTAHDIDKLVRAVIDGLVQGGALEDDRHVISLTATKHYADRAIPEGVDVTIATAVDAEVQIPAV